MSGTYSFLDVQAAIEGPGGKFELGSGSGNAEEGITIARAEDKNTLTMGADGSGMHSLHAGRHGTVTITLLKTSPRNQQLMTMYNFQQTSSANWGQNFISIRNYISGDGTTAKACAFKKVPDLTYAKDGNTHQWVFDAIAIDTILGSGTPEL
ncbi:DUF3277 family protein [Kaistia dalseonensis]|uniref:DUF3277 family protein n=1 Tax=Kaistia dalseonensis TaxID=410840 RepID=A0ABU0H6M8_9HYPH|nr:phage protein [Kaistia dalseonensis]MCX5495370.1 DUF3277 family protein [Kaistia dalseonensis]MDQ0437957.1 hypothetical protein [Kaistia dalseonensis]